MKSTWTPALTGAAAIDACGEPYPDSTHAFVGSLLMRYFLVPLVILNMIMILLPTVRPEQGLLKMRKKIRAVR